MIKNINKNISKRNKEHFESGLEGIIIKHVPIVPKSHHKSLDDNPNNHEDMNSGIILEFNNISYHISMNVSLGFLRKISNVSYKYGIHPVKHKQNKHIKRYDKRKYKVHSLFHQVHDENIINILVNMIKQKYSYTESILHIIHIIKFIRYFSIDYDLFILKQNNEEMIGMIEIKYENIKRVFIYPDQFEYVNGMLNDLEIRDIKFVTYILKYIINKQ